MQNRKTIPSNMCCSFGSTISCVLSLIPPLLLSSPGGLRQRSQHPESLLGLQSDLWDQTLGCILESPFFPYSRCLGKYVNSCMENPNDADGLRNG